MNNKNSGWLIQVVTGLAIIILFVVFYGLLQLDSVLKLIDFYNTHYWLNFINMLVTLGLFYCYTV